MKTTKRIAEAWYNWNFNEYHDNQYRDVVWEGNEEDGTYLRPMTKWEKAKTKIWRMFPRWFRFAVDCLIQKKRELHCKLKGHDMQSDDYCSPDSGYMGCSCKRCGQSWGNWMY